MAFAVLRFWEIHACGHPVPYDIDAWVKSDETEPAFRQRLESEAKARKSAAQGFCPACLPIERNWRWNIRRRARRANLPPLAGDNSKQAKTVRRRFLKKLDQHLIEWRHILESPWRPPRLSVHQEQFRQALTAGPLLEKHTGDRWWLDRRRLDISQLMAEFVEPD